MGTDNSKLPRVDPNMDFFLVAFQPPDRLRIVAADDGTIDVVRRTIYDSWPDGLSTDSRCNDGSYKLRFVGNPFSSSSSNSSSSKSSSSSTSNTYQSKLLTLRILSNLYDHGWRLINTSELTKDQVSSTWYFRRRIISKSPPQSNDRLICLALHSADRIQLINANESIRRLFEDTIRRDYAPGIVDAREKPMPSSVEFRLAGKPWWNDVDHSTTNDSPNGPLEARRLVLRLIRRFHRRGYEIYGTSNSGDGSRCVYFLRDDSDFDGMDEPMDDEDHRDRDRDRFFLISLYDDDGLLLIDADDRIVEATKRTISDAWPGGIQYERLQSSTSTSSSNDRSVSRFKIKGRPWRTSGPELIASRRFASNLFRTLLSIGWRVQTALEFNLESIGGKSTSFVMRSSGIDQSSKNLTHVCVNLCESNKIRLIGDGSWVARHQSTTSLSGGVGIGRKERCSSVDSSSAASTASNSTSANQHRPVKHRTTTSTPTLRRRHSSSSKRRLTKSTRSNEITAGEFAQICNVASSPPMTPRLLITPPSDEHLCSSSSVEPPPIAAMSNVVNVIPQSYVELIRTVRTAIERSWPLGIDRERDYYGSREFRLNGCPWTSSSNSSSSDGSRSSSSSKNGSLAARITMLYVLKSIVESGWTVYASADISSSKLYPLSPVKGALTSTTSNNNNNDDVAKDSSVETTTIHPLAPASSDVHNWYLVYNGSDK